MKNENTSKKSHGMQKFYLNFELLGRSQQKSSGVHALHKVN